jgi:malate dehydrogenase
LEEEAMKASIIGAAGSVGAPVAFYLAASGLADTIVMIDVRTNLVKQHAMDIGTAASAGDVRVTDGDYEDLAGSDIVINTAGAPQGLIADRMEMLPKNILLICDIASQIKRHCPRAIVLTVTNPVDPLNYATWRTGGFDRRQLLGYTINDSFRFREMVAQAKGVPVSSVQATVIGEHGSSQVLLFSSVRIDGHPVHFSDDEKQSIRTELPHILKRYEELKSGRTAGWTTAVGMASMVRAIVQDSGEIFPCSVLLDGEYGQKDLGVSVPVAIGREGAQKIMQLDLLPDEQAGLTRCIDMLKNAARVVNETMS